MAAGATVEQRLGVEMADSAIPAPAAPEPAVGILADSVGRSRRVYHTLGACDKELSCLCVEPDAFLIERVVVLADSEIHCAIETGEVHINLYLRPVLIFRRLDAISPQVRK